MSYNSIIGSRAEVWHGNAKKTSGGLTKSHLMKNKSGRIVSRKKHFSAKKDNRLVKAGFKTKKGHFGFVKVGSRKHGKSKGKRGGNPFLRGGKYMAHLMPAPLSDSGDNALSRALVGGAPYGDNIAGANITDFGGSSTAVQLRAGMAGGKRHKHRRSHKMRGGVGQLIPMDITDPTARSLLA